MRTVEWPERESFIAHLDRLKKSRGFRYDIALAEAAEISHSAISNWRSGKQRPSLAAIGKLAAALDVDQRDLAARAGVAEGFTHASMPTQLPPELETLFDQYQTADPSRRDELLQRVAWVSEWFDATTSKAGDERPRRAG
ncbi:helix-turn-helix domain-containing protein [Micromonospora polyrhachis]|uniref:helix-turn-helix domain-containing protein n=1 Tax=Micromonospora polyrhachis TaxID=1282883 RepID=UPI001C8827AC|nr:helix-turn-helix transcriptional regulator [Micromonospora polyrhachis]